MSLFKKVIKSAYALLLSVGLGQDWSKFLTVVNQILVN